MSLEPETSRGSSGVVFSGARILNDNTQSIPSGAATNYALDTQIYDTDAYWAIGSPTLIVVPSDGYYRVTALAEFEPAAGTYRQVRIAMGGSIQYRVASVPPAVGVLTSVVMTGADALDAADVVIVSVVHDAVGAVLVSGYVEIERLGDV